LDNAFYMEFLVDESDKIYDLSININETNTDELLEFYMRLFNHYSEKYENTSQDNSAFRCKVGDSWLNISSKGDDEEYHISIYYSLSKI